MRSSRNFIINGLVATLFAGVSLLNSTSAQAGIVVSYPDFTGACGITLTCVGDTAVSGTALRVTPADYSKTGAGYSTTPITLGAGATFSTMFQFQFTSAGGIDPADGITFVLAQNTAGLGGAGSGIG